MKVREQCFSSLDNFLVDEIRVWQKLHVYDFNEDLRGEPTSCDVSLPVMCNKNLANICSVQMQK